MTRYDSYLDTIRHIVQVGAGLQQAIEDLEHRRDTHDRSKLEEPEKAIFDKYTPLLRESTYGSREYKRLLREMKPALDHHYANNRHHPEWHKSGIAGMTLVDLIEMLADWRAASERHATGSLARSLDVNEERFKIDAQLMSVLRNTAKEMGWLDG